MSTLGRRNVIRDFENLTVCIFTKDRQENLLRQIEYYRNTGINLIALDGTKEAIGIEDDLHFRYYHLPEAQLHERILYLRGLIKTEFVALQADDDFHGLEGLHRCTSFLKGNLDYSCAQGRYLRMYSQKPFNWLPDYTFQNSLRIDNKNASQRVNSFISSGMHFIYSVIRTEIFLEILSCLEGIKTGIPSMFEHLFSLTLGIHGKYQTVPSFYSIRESSLGPNSGIRFENWEFSSPELNKDFLTFTNNIALMYSVNLNISPADAEELLKSYINELSERSRLKQELSGAAEGVNVYQKRKFKNLVSTLVTYTHSGWVLPLRKFDTWRLLNDLIKKKALLALIKDLWKISRTLKLSSPISHS